MGVRTGPKITGTPARKIPAFSLAIWSSLSPSTFVCSLLIVVTAVASERGRVLVASKRPPRPTSQRLEEGEVGRVRGEYTIERLIEKRIVDGLPIDANALCETTEMRRGVHPSPKSRAARDGFHHRADAAFAVGPSHMYGVKALLWVAERRERGVNAVEPEGHPTKPALE